MRTRADEPHNMAMKGPGFARSSAAKQLERATPLVSPCGCDRAARAAVYRRRGAVYSFAVGRSVRSRRGGLRVLQANTNFRTLPQQGEP